MLGNVAGESLAPRLVEERAVLEASVDDLIAGPGQTDILVWVVPARWLPSEDQRLGCAGRKGVANKSRKEEERGQKHVWRSGEESAARVRVGSDRSTGASSTVEGKIGSATWLSRGERNVPVAGEGASVELCVNVNASNVDDENANAK